MNYGKVNVDGSCFANNKIAAGDLIHDDKGNWLVGFVLATGIGSIQAAALRGIYDGLCLAWNYAYNCIRLECDSMDIVLLFQDPLTTHHPLHNLVQDCKEILSRNWKCTIQHIHREANYAANQLAHSGLLQAGNVYYK